MTTMKEAVLKNDCLRKQERLGYRIVPLVILSRVASGRAPIGVICRGCLLIRVYIKSKCQGYGL